MSFSKTFKMVQRWVTFICVAFSLLMIFSMVWISSYSVLVADDFSHGLEVGSFNEALIPYFFSSVRFVKKIYFDCSGAYFTMFLQALLSPINHYGLSQLRVVMAVNSAFFFVSLLLFLCFIIKRIRIVDMNVTILIVTTILFSICGYHTYPEVFFWFSGATGYGFPFSMLMLALICFISMDDEGMSPWKTVGAIILGLCAIGGNLTVSGTGCYIALLVVIFNFIKTKTMPKKKVYVFIIWLIGAFINALAPGQFNRHDMMEDTGIHVGKSIINSLIMVQDRYEFLFGFNFILVLVILMLCGGVVGRNISHDSVLFFIFALAGLLTPLVTAFPYAIGTNNEGGAPDRVAFVMDMSIIFSLSFLVFVFGVMVSNVFYSKSRLGIIIFILIIMGLYCKYDGYGLSDFKPLELSRGEIEHHIYSDHYNNHVRFYKWLGEHKGEDVVVDYEHCPYGVDNVYNLYLMSDPDFWVNKCIAMYTGTKSIRTDYD